MGFIPALLIGHGGSVQARNGGERAVTLGDPARQLPRAADAGNQIGRRRVSVLSYSQSASHAGPQYPSDPEGSATSHVAVRTQAEQVGIDSA